MDEVEELAELAESSAVELDAWGVPGARRSRCGRVLVAEAGSEGEAALLSLWAGRCALEQRAAAASPSHGGGRVAGVPLWTEPPEEEAGGAAAAALFLLSRGRVAAVSASQPWAEGQGNERRGRWSAIEAAAWVLSGCQRCQVEEDTRAAVERVRADGGDDAERLEELARALDEGGSQVLARVARLDAERVRLARELWHAAGGAESRGAARRACAAAVTRLFEGSATRAGPAEAEDVARRALLAGTGMRLREGARAPVREEDIGGAPAWPHLLEAGVAVHWSRAVRELRGGRPHRAAAHAFLAGRAGGAAASGARLVAAGWAALSAAAAARETHDEALWCAVRCAEEESRAGGPGEGAALVRQRLREDTPRPARLRALRAVGEAPELAAASMPPLPAPGNEVDESFWHRFAASTGAGASQDDAHERFLAAQSVMRRPVQEPMGALARAARADGVEGPLAGMDPRIVHAHLGHAAQPPPPCVAEAMVRAARDDRWAGQYRTRVHPALLDRAAAFFARECGLRGASRANILVDTGVTPLLGTVLSVVLGRGAGGVVLTHPGFYHTHAGTVHAAGGRLVVVPSADPATPMTGADLRRAWAAADAGTRSRCRALLLYQPVPNTGTVHGRAALREIAAFAAERCLFVISDEVFRGTEHAPGTAAPIPCVASEPRCGGACAVLYSTSKSVGNVTTRVAVAHVPRGMVFFRGATARAAAAAGHPEGDAPAPLPSPSLDFGRAALYTVFAVGWAAQAAAAAAFAAPREFADATRAEAAARVALIREELLPALNRSAPGRGVALVGRPEAGLSVTLDFSCLLGLRAPGAAAPLDGSLAVFVHFRRHGVSLSPGYSCGYHQHGTALLSVCHSELGADRLLPSMGLAERMERMRGAGRRALAEAFARMGEAVRSLE